MSRALTVDVEAEQRLRGIDAWRRVCEAGITVWAPGMPVDQNAGRVLVGLAPAYSLPDAALIDRLLLSLPFPEGLRVDLFDASRLGAMRDIKRFIPGLEHFYHTPVVGVWRDGVLVEQREGFDAGRLIESILFRAGGIAGEKG